MQSSPRVRLVAFADGDCAPRSARFLREAAAMNVFADAQVWNASRLPPAFARRHMPFLLTHRRGFGYWIWKPWVIAAALEQSSGDDLVIYLDAGFTLNPAGRGRLLEYCEIAASSPFRMLSFQSVHTECLWTKADLAHRLGVARNASIMMTSQLSSGFMILGKTAENVDLIRQWQDIAVEDGYRYSDDSPSVELNHSAFREHRHDQSIASLLRKIRGTTITHYEVQPYDQYFAELRPQLPAWAMRLRF